METGNSNLLCSHVWSQTDCISKVMTLASPLRGPRFGWHLFFQQPQKPPGSSPGLLVDNMIGVLGRTRTGCPVQRLMRPWRAVLEVITHTWGPWKSAGNTNTLIVKVLGGSCHAARGPSFQGTVIQTSSTVQVTNSRAPESPLCVPHPHSGRPWVPQGVFPPSYGHLPTSKSVHFERGAPHSNGRTRVVNTTEKISAASPALQTVWIGGDTGSRNILL